MGRRVEALDDEGRRRPGTEPRALRSLRVWVDTDVVAGWPEIDTVGLVPVPQP